LSYSLNDASSDSITVTMIAPSPSSSPSYGVTITSVANDVVYAILVVLDSIAQTITELAPYLITFFVEFSVLHHTYNAARGVIRRYFGGYFRV